MTNEEVRKLINYGYQIRTFALSLKDDTVIANQPEWKDFAKRLLVIGNQMAMSIDSTCNEKEID